MMRFLVKRALTVVALLAAAGGIALADDFPSRPVQLMVAFPPGGSTEIGARVVAAIAEKIPGKPMAVLKRLEEVLRKAMEDPEHVQKLESAGLAIKIMVGEEYARYYRDTHAQAKKYTEWAKSRPHK